MKKSSLRRPLGMENLESRQVLATLYVSPSGNDGNAGSSSAPWQTLQHAADVVSAGDTVIVRAGNYTGFDLRSDGTAAARIVFQGEDGVNITARNARTPDGINLEGADFVTIDGFNVNGMPRAGIRTVLNQHVIIRNNTTDANGVWGIFSGFSDDLLIEHNVASHSVEQHGIYVSNSGDRPIIRGNTIFGNSDAGIHMNGDISQGGDGIISGALVENNVIYDNGVGGGSGINCDGVQDSTFQNNLLYDNHASGVSFYQIDGGGPSSGNILANNTIDMASNGRWALNIQDGAINTTIVNNILYNNHSFRGSIDISSDSLPGLQSDYNVVMNRFTTDGGDSILSLIQWQALGHDQHSLVATPSQLFVDPASGNYHLSASSPALDAGTSQDAPSDDFEHQPRPSGTGWDIGADERQVAANNHAPLLDNSLNPKLSSIREDDASPATTLVSTLVKDAVTDADAGALKGIAVTAASNYHGTWQYSLNDGGSWLPMNQPGSAAARLLPDNAQIRFLPKQDFNGQVRIYYRAWDQTQGNVGGTLNTQGHLGGSNSLSTASENATLTVKPVNDKPVLSVSGSIGYTHDTAAITLAAGAIVSDIDSPNFSGGRLRVWITDGASISNRLAIGSGFTVDASNNVLQGSTIIGQRVSSGWGTSDLIVRFNAAVTSSVAQALVRAITFRTVNGAAGSRAVNFTVSDGDGGVSEAASKTVNVS